MDKELLMIISMTLGVLLYTLGGWKWKWLRRELLPLAWGVCLILAQVSLWKVLLFILLQDLVFRLPYGDKTPYWLKTLVGCSFVLPSLLFGFTIWQAIVPIVFITTFILSNRIKTSAEFTWKICEGITGFLLGIIIARVIGGI